MTTWGLWRDERYDVHLVQNNSIGPFEIGRTLPPWHLYDMFCPCQPEVIQEDVLSGKRVIKHKDLVH